MLAAKETLIGADDNGALAADGALLPRGAEAERLKEHSKNSGNKMLKFFKKIGFWGFMFFLVKGLVWIAIFLGVGKLFS